MGRIVVCLALALFCAFFQKTNAKDFLMKSSRYKKLFKHENWMDKSLPLPHSVHDLGHVVKPKRKLASLNAELTPLYPGYGTHFSYVYVGTPPQRQSVIIDTGSHYTAFPCTGCSQCGQHTDPYFNLKNSSSAVVPKCVNQQPCVISQSYTEGSSWHAFKVTDKLWVGSAGMNLIPGADQYNVNFTFGCQTSETGLFRTQLADGIMGMSISDDTLPAQLKQQGVVDNRIFALCFRIGGGIMTLGGVDQRIHTKKTVSYVKLDSKSNGWFGVIVTDIILEAPTDSKSVTAVPPLRIPLGVDKAKYATGKGTIVDSGTTDTYLPTEIATKFNEIFKKISGTAFSGGNIKLTAEQLAKLPTIVYLLEGVDGSPVEISMPWASYVDSVGDGKYSFRIYLTEKSGAVLGANFMNGYNIVFDADGKRVGFAKSLCNYEEFAPIVTKGPTPKPTTYPGEADSDGPCTGNEMIAYTECTARCDKTDAAYVATGTQDYVSKCNPNSGAMESRTCSENCAGMKVVRGNPECPDKPWTECGHSCIMSRATVPPADPLKVNGKCNYHTQTSTCYTGGCPIDNGDYLIYIDMRVRIEPWRWSYVHTEAFYTAMAVLFKLKTRNVELLNDAGNEYSSGTKLHFSIRLEAKDYKGVMALHNAAEKIAVSVQAPEFPNRLIHQLDTAASPYDGVKINRFGWLFDEDVQILNAVAMPIGMGRDPFADPPPKELSYTSKANLTLLGVAVAAVLVLAFVLWLHWKLRTQHALYEKDKGNLGQGGMALTRMWNRFASIASQRGHLEKGSSLSSMSKTRKNYEVEMANMGLLKEGDNENEEEEEEFFKDDDTHV